MVNQYEIYWIDLDPTKGSEIKKVCPCVIISPNEMNKYLKTIIIAPITSKNRYTPFRIKVKVNDKNGLILLDQIRTVDKSRISGLIGKLSIKTQNRIKEILNEMLVK